MEVTTETAASGIGPQRHKTTTASRPPFGNVKILKKVLRTQGKKDRRETALGATHYQIGDVDIATVLLTVFSNCLVSDNEQSVTDKKTSLQAVRESTKTGI